MGVLWAGMGRGAIGENPEQKAAKETKGKAEEFYRRSQRTLRKGEAHHDAASIKTLFAVSR